MASSAATAQLEAKLKQAQNQLLALKNDVNEKELALLENDAAFAKQLFHMKKLLGEREKASGCSSGDGSGVAHFVCARSLSASELFHLPMGLWN
jgi:hypothetical protein